MKKRLLIILCVLLTMLGISSCRNYYVPVLIPGVNTPNENTPTGPNNPGDDGSEDNPNNPDDTKPENPDGEDGDNPNPDEGGETDPSNPSGGDEDNPTNPDEGEETNPDTGEEKPNPDEGEGGEEVNPNPGEGEEEKPENPEDQIERDLVYNKFKDILSFTPDLPPKENPDTNLYTGDEINTFADFIKQFNTYTNIQDITEWFNQQIKYPSDYPTSSIASVNDEIKTVINSIQTITPSSHSQNWISATYNDEGILYIVVEDVSDWKNFRAINLSSLLAVYYIGDAFPTYIDRTNQYTYIKSGEWIAYNNFNYFLLENSKWKEITDREFESEYKSLNTISGSQNKELIERRICTVTYDNSPVNIEKIMINETDNYYYYEFPELYNGISEIFVVNDEICYVYGTEYNGYYSL